ncbi:MAG: LPS export ABC transporter periplasmic protein LptC [Thiotrichaceae bacterium]|nr:LPS export ABC transporter periplasmic protein LptC [Thiotrichaceae bacterium]
MLNRLSAWLLLISLVIATLWLMHSLDEMLSKSPENNNPVADYTMKGFKSSQMDQDGVLKSKLTAATMIHYPQTNATLTAPNLVFYKEKQPIWTLHAERGEVSPDGKHVWLLDRTTLLRHDKKYPLKIISEDVMVDIDTEHAETSAFTTIISNKDRNHSVGVQIDMPIGQIDLLSQVRGHYVLP